MFNIQNVGEPTYAQGIPGHLQEPNQFQPVFSDQELDTYFDTVENPSTTISVGTSKDLLIGRERLKNILNVIEQSPAGRNILVVLKKLLGDNPDAIKRICFSVVDGQSKFKEGIIDYLNVDNISNLKFDNKKFKTGDFLHKGVKIFHEKMLKDWKISLMIEDLLSDSKTIKKMLNFLLKNNLIEKEYEQNAKDLANVLYNNYTFNSNSNTINIDKNLESAERFVFDGEKIVALNLEEMLGSKEAAEAYLVAHELVHCIQFLSNKDNVMHKATNDDWMPFLKTERMKQIYDTLNKNYSDENICNTFTILFKNVEEARNLLGFVPENRKDLPNIGEFFWFNEKQKYLLPTYLTETEELGDIEKAVLKTIANAKGFEISLLNGSMTAEEKKVVNNGGFV